jgi:hypothetical protein
LEIKLNEEYKIITDELNFILAQKHIYGEKSKNQGQEYWDNIAYFGSLEALLTEYKTLMTLRVNIFMEKQLDELFEELKKIKQEIKIAGKGVKKYLRDKEGDK